MTDTESSIGKWDVERIDYEFRSKIGSAHALTIWRSIRQLKDVPVLFMAKKLMGDRYEDHRRQRTDKEFRRYAQMYLGGYISKLNLVLDEYGFIIAPGKARGTYRLYKKAS